ncbi:MAG: BlaI/MecI/CopY family transcriptional regulator [Phycisphaeraceae bacterium]|nr:BlaI/MecI/CopY family transcriptional regulator [Phycisphaeraceae bacterium]
MARPAPEDLTRRERQIMDIVYKQGQVSVTEVLDGLPDPPSYSAVRAILRILEDKGHLKHRKVGMKYIYLPTRTPRQAARAALKRVMKTFFEGSLDETLNALLAVSDTRLSPQELHRLADLVRAGPKD